MNTYEITYTTDSGQKARLIEGEGLSEAVDTFINTWCPVISIDSVVKLFVSPVVNKENRPA